MSRRRYGSGARDPERTRQILDMHCRDHMTLSQISAVVGVSRERVRQIVRSQGVTRLESRVLMQVKRRRYCVRCGVPFLPRARTSRFCGVACAAENSRHDDADMIRYMQDLAARLGRTPTKVDLDEAGPPSVLSYQKHFGSLRAAQAAAGLVPNGRGRPARPKS